MLREGKHEEVVRGLYINHKEVEYFIPCTSAMATLMLQLTQGSVLRLVPPDARVFSADPTTSLHPLFLHMPAGVPVRAQLTVLCFGTLWDSQNQPNHLWNVTFLQGGTVGRAWKVSQLLSEPACAHAVKQVAPGVLVRWFPSLQSSKKIATVIAESSERLIGGFW